MSVRSYARKASAKKRRNVKQFNVKEQWIRLLTHWHTFNLILLVQSNLFAARKADVELSSREEFPCFTEIHTKPLGEHDKLFNEKRWEMKLHKIYRYERKNIYLFVSVNLLVRSKWTLYHPFAFVSWHWNLFERSMGIFKNLTFF